MKRTRSDEEISLHEHRVKRIKAQDAISLNFLNDYTERESIHRIRPIFSHQLFQDEMITYEDNIPPKVTIDISLIDLRHQVHVDTNLESDRKNIFKNLQLALPDDHQNLVEINNFHPPGTLVHKFCLLYTSPSPRD